MSLTNKPLKKGKTILLFDVDGTLTPARLSVESDMVELLKSVKEAGKYDMASVGGSDFKKAKEQLKDSTSNLKYMFTENGVVSYDETGNIFHSKRISEQLGEENLKKFINFCLRYIADLDIPIKRGTFVEFRTGMINVSPIGRNCSQEERVAFGAYNKEHKILEKFREELLKNFGKEMDLDVVIGGQISFDCIPNGWDKRYCLQFLKDYDNIIFFGDKTMEGGNDYTISHCDGITRGISVNGPKDTIEKVKAILAELDAL
ncbi:MAG: HAD-IIB family hydrolase [archaeon]|nr:HAD-IIB family hydrolase [archaeon]